MLDFTDDRAKLHDALLRLQPRPIAGTGTTECPNISYYMADMIQNKHDSRAEQAAIQDALGCIDLPVQTADQQRAALQSAQMTVSAETSQQLSIGNQESRVALGVLKDVVRRISLMPGQRSLVIVSPGFLTPESDMLQDYMDVIDRALHSDVVISALDARGLYTIMPGGDVSQRGPTNGVSSSIESQYQTDSALAESDVLSDLAYGTGGAFFHNNNDLNEGFKQVSATPEYFYTLGFSPQSLKLDGTYHKIRSLAERPGQAYAAGAPRILRSQARRRSSGRSEAGNPGCHLFSRRNARPARATAHAVF